MKPDWEGIALCLLLVSGIWVACGPRAAGWVLVCLVLVLARARWNRGPSQ